MLTTGFNALSKIPRLFNISIIVITLYIILVIRCYKVSITQIGYLLNLYAYI
jgi:hypothetical protein